MEELYKSLGIASVMLALLGGLALVIHGFNFIVIHKHYYNDKH